MLRGIRHEDVWGNSRLELQGEDRDYVTTEAELLSLSSGGREVCWWMRFFKAISLSLDQGVEIFFDCQQTVTKDDPGFAVHHHWLRQEVQQGNIHISWKLTSEMPVDGMTKALTTQNTGNFYL